MKINGTKLFYSDLWRLKVIFNNIISNSIRYRNGKAPMINIQIDILKEKANISIKDSGRGIAEEYIKKVFNMFYRATDDNAGSGLGLYIVHETIHKLNGRVALQSKINNGTLVEISIPNLQHES
jgi:signal transduction histidine kinase